MRITPLHRNDPSDYSCVCYWILGENNTAADRNTLIDTGSAHEANFPFYLQEMARQSKGIGKKAVEQVILTHSHFDHTGGLPGFEHHFNPVTWAWLPLGSNHKEIQDAHQITVGDQQALLLHTPGHSEDSICIFLPATGTLFSGDTLYRITDHLGAYPAAYVKTLERLANLKIQSIYPGHGHPILHDAAGFVRQCLENVSQSLIQD